MVGGFCASPLLQDAIREEYDDPGRDLKVVVAPRPGLAVVSGSLSAQQNNWVRKCLMWIVVLAHESPPCVAVLFYCRVIVSSYFTVMFGCHLPGLL